ncbi:MAG: hypothetical protein ACR2M0_02680 [Chloroflexia bacterium]
MRLIVHLGLAFCSVLLPLICLCQFIPGQTHNGPYLLLFPHPHALAAQMLTDDQLTELAISTGQAVSVADDGTVTFGYDSTPPSATLLGTALQLPGAPPEQNPSLDAGIPTGPGQPPSPRLCPQPSSAQAGAAQYHPAPPEPPPRAVSFQPLAFSRGTAW